MRNKEWRWEFIEIGQGHYYIKLAACVEDAKKASEERPGSIVKVEQFRPKREMLTRFKDGEEIGIENVQEECPECNHVENECDC